MYHHEGFDTALTAASRKWEGTLCWARWWSSPQWDPECHQSSGQKGRLLEVPTWYLTGGALFCMWNLKCWKSFIEYFAWDDVLILTYLKVFWKPPQSTGMKDSEAWAARRSNVSRTALRWWFLPKKGTFRTALYLVLSFIERLPVRHTARTRHSGPPCPRETTSPSLTSGGKERSKLRFGGISQTFNC